MDKDLQAFSESLDAALFPIMAQLAAVYAGVFAALRGHAQVGVDVRRILDEMAKTCFATISSSPQLTERQREMLQGAFDHHLGILRVAAAPTPSAHP